MRSARTLSLLLPLAVALVVGPAVAAIDLASDGLSEGTLWRALVAGGVSGLAVLLVLLPFMLSFDRTVSRLSKELHAAVIADADSAPPAAPAWARPLVRTFYDAAGEARQHRATLLDEKRDVEVLLRATEAERAQLKGVLQELGDAVLVTNAFDEVLVCNRAALSVFGLKEDDVVGGPLRGIIRDERLAQLIRDVRQAGNVSDRRMVEYELKTADGKRAFEASVSCLANLRHEVGAVVTILHDLSRERELSQMKSDFVSKASHELRTPLASIRAYVEMLVDGEATDEDARREFYEVIQNETDRLGRLIDNMLNISRIEAGIIQIERKSMGMGEIVTRAVETLEPQARGKDISIHTKIAPIDLTVEGDADMLYQVALNLLSNAIKYTPEGGRVTVTADSDNLTRSVVVSIADTGLGIPPDALPKLFDKFFRVENYKRMANGTGLGLNLCKHIVETVHQGQIGVESRLGMGSKFWFSVPMRYAGSQAA